MKDLHSCQWIGGLYGKRVELGRDMLCNGPFIWLLDGSRDGERDSVLLESEIGDDTDE